MMDTTSIVSQMVRTRFATDSGHASSQPPREENPSRVEKMDATPSPPTEVPKDQKLARQETGAGETFASSEEIERPEKAKGEGRGRGRRATPGRGRGRGRGRKNTLPTEPDNRKPESKAVSTPSKASPVPKASPSPRTHSPVTVSPHAGHAALPRPKRMKRPSAATSSLKRPSGSHEEIAESKDDVWIQFHNMDKPLNLNNLSPSQEMMLERGVPFNYVPGPHEQEQPVHDEQADEPSEPMNSKPNHALKMQPKATVKCSLRKPASKSPKARGSEKVSHVGTRNLFWYLESF